MIGETTHLSADHAIGITVTECHGGDNGAVGTQEHATALDRDTVSAGYLVIVPRVLFVLVVATRVDDVNVFAQTDA